MFQSHNFLKKVGRGNPGRSLKRPTEGLPLHISVHPHLCPLFSIFRLLPGLTPSLPSSLPPFIPTWPQERPIEDIHAHVAAPFCFSEKRKAIIGMKRRGCEKNHHGEISIPRIYTNGYQPSSNSPIHNLNKKEAQKEKK